MGILTRAPQRGRSKTRLAARVGEPGALRLATAFLRDTAAALRDASAWHTTLFVEPGSAVAAVAALAGIADARPQSSGSIGARMQQAAQSLTADGYAPVILVGSDIPTLGATHVRAALAALQSADVVWGPAEDGGYYLIGLHRMHPALFDDAIPWSTPGVLAASKRAAAAAGLVVERIAAESDIDTVTDLDRLQQRLAGSAADDTAPHTRAALQETDWGEQR